MANFSHRPDPAAASTDTELVERWIGAMEQTDNLNPIRVAILENAVRHVLRYGKVGKQSEARLRAALKAVEVSRG